MSESPDFYLRNPDPLSTLLSRLELKAQVFANGDYRGAWAVDTSGSKKIPFHTQISVASATLGYYAAKRIAS